MRLIFIFVLFLYSSLSFSQEDSYPDNSLLLKHLRINVQVNVLQVVRLQSEIGKIDRFLNNSFSGGFEFVYNYKENLCYGIGAFYQLKSSIDTTLGDLGLLPVYIFIDYPLIQNNSFPIYLSTQLGYSPLILNNGLNSVNGGIFHSFGFTTSISKNIQLKFLYAYNYGKVKLEKNNFSLRKENLSVACYYKF